MHVDPRCRVLIDDLNSLTFDGRTISFAARGGSVSNAYRDLYALVPEYLRELRSRGETDAAESILDAIEASL